MNTVCGICGKEGKDNEYFTIRESWGQAGGFGSIPLSARVHVACDKKEQQKLKSGKILLKDIYTKK